MKKRLIVGIQAAPNTESVLVEQWGNGRFNVTYGKDVQTGLGYADAAKHFGECIFHALACAGELDNTGPV